MGVRQANPLWNFSVTWNCKDGWDEKTFEAKYETFKAAMENVGKKWIFQLERGAENKRLHYQGYLNVEQRTRDTALAKVLREELEGVNVKPSSTAGLKALRTYCMKADTKVAGPWMDKEIKKDFNKEAVEKELAYDPKDEDAWFFDGRIKPWQQGVVDYINGPTDQRKILWITDEKGSCGKTSLTKVLVYQDPDRRSVLSYAKANDLLHMVVKDGPRAVYIFDLTRAKEADLGIQDLYQSLEQVKNGMVVSGKYSGERLMFKRPKVVVFSNHKPVKEHMSYDRWDCRYVRTVDQTLQMAVDEQHSAVLNVWNPVPQ